MDKKIKVHMLQLGEIKENCYVIEIDGKGIIVDPGQEPEKIDNFLKEGGN